MLKRGSDATATFARTLAAALLLGAAQAATAQLEIVSADPAFKAVVPSFPKVALGEHPMRAGRPHLRLFGSEGAYTVSVLVPTADAGMGPLECASSSIRTLGERPGVPQPDKVYKAKLDDRTFVAIYVARMGGLAQLHAHLFSAAGGTHCVEIHLSKVSTSPEDGEAWFRGFGSARFEPAP